MLNVNLILKNTKKSSFLKKKSIFLKEMNELKS